MHNTQTFPNEFVHFILYGVYHSESVRIALFWRSVVGGIITLGQVQRGAIVHFRLSVISWVFRAFIPVLRRLRAPAR